MVLVSGKPAGPISLEPTMIADATLPAARFNLTERARFEHNGDSWVVYSDEMFYDVVLAADFDRETVEDDYSRWCSSTQVGNRQVYVAALDVLGVDDLNTGAEGTVRRQQD